MSQVNTENFLRWFDPTADTGIPRSLPHAYWNDRQRCGYAPIGLPGETLSFYINTPEGFTFSTFSDLRLALVKVDGDSVINGNIATLNQNFLDPPTDLFYNIWANVTIPAAVNSNYYFRIYRNTGGTELLRSSYIRIDNDTTKLYNTTTYVKFRHDRYFYGIKYADIPSFYQRFRLDLNLLESQVESDKEVYKEVTTGKQRTFNNYLSRFHKVEGYYFDEEAHFAAAIMIEHDYLEMNAKRYRLKSSYKINPRLNSKLSKSEFEVYDEEFSSANRC
jgi:hypothetical protein